MTEKNIVEKYLLCAYDATIFRLDEHFILQPVSESEFHELPTDTKLILTKTQSHLKKFREKWLSKLN